MEPLDASLPPIRVVKLLDDYIVLYASKNLLSQRWDVDGVLGGMEPAKIINRMATGSSREPNPAIAASANDRIDR